MPPIDGSLVVVVADQSSRQRANFRNFINNYVNAEVLHGRYLGKTTGLSWWRSISGFKERLYVKQHGCVVM